jgi:hypothetical protein
MKSNQQNKPAIIYQSLYLSNLLLVPLVSFLLLVFYLYKAKRDKSLSKFNRIHLIRSIQISALAGLMLGIAPIFYIFYSEEFGSSVMISIFYFVTLHTGFVLIGMLNLARAMSKKLPLF